MSFPGWKSRLAVGFVCFALPTLAGALALASPAALASDESGSLHVFINPSARRINWSSPRALLWSTLRSKLASQRGAATGARETALGHVVIHFDCRDERGERRTGWVGMTGQNDAGVDRRDLLQNQIGMKVLFKLYPDGELVSDAVSRDQVVTNPGRFEWDGIVPRVMHSKFMRFDVQPSQCSEIHEYVSIYRQRSYDQSMPLGQWRKRGPDKILYYGFPLRDPIENFRRVRAGETGVPLGGGCTAYGVSFLKLLGVHTDEFERFFSTRFSISESLIGKKAPSTGERSKVSVLDILFGSVGLRWNHADIADRPIELYDPQRMWDFIDGVQSCAKVLGLEGAGAVKAYRRNCTPELLEWTREHASSLAPAEQLWVSKQVVRYGVAFR